MALIPEDGTGLANADSLCSLAFADQHHADRGITLWASMTTAEREQALRRATDFMGEVYRRKWAGYRVKETQALDWPREWVPREPIERPPNVAPLSIFNATYYPSDAVPLEVQRACAELAYRAGFGPLAPDVERETLREKLDVLEVEYNPNAPAFVSYRAVENLLAPFFKRTVSTVAARVVRT